MDRRPRRTKSENQPKTEYERQRTQEEVSKIKKDLMNFARTRWGKQWIHSILDIGRPFRMQRGIQYAEDEDRIENLTITKGQLFATVQGTAPSPYRVKVVIEIIPEDGWKRIGEALASRKINLIQLLEGKLPQDILSIFEEAHYPLFLEKNELEGMVKDEKITCSCPDKAIPCKHIAALILYIAKVLDYNPFILLELRGKTKEDILNSLSLTHKAEIDKIDKKRKDIEFQFNVPKNSISKILSEESNLEALTKIGFKFKKPGKIIETLENLGIPQNLNNPKAFETVLEGIYRAVTLSIYNMAMKLEKPKK